ncbi:Atxe2 family lasso peptide isopeptidase [Luteimonas saliphila]|uniref:Atxe2 family lasso peptide isopeptidase n=1 Tax=Luteimonas saliphila TaxID=2804919 RepID=UPI00192DB753|nr:Atxe2 family lasso peptide isopeptidase [Luteimonas saliphila]
MMIFLRNSLVVTALLVVGACPSVAKAITPRALVEVVDFNQPVLSPDGRSVAFRLEHASVERNSYDTAWYVQNMDGATPPRRVGEGGFLLRDSAGNALPTPVAWSPDGQWIYYRALHEGKVSIWRAAADGSGTEAVTNDSADVRAFYLSDDGTTLSYSVGATREEVVAAELSEYDHGIRIDETVPVGQGLFRSSRVDGRWATQRFNGLWFQRVPLLADTPDRWKTIDLLSMVTRDLASSDVPFRPMAASDLPDGLPEPWKLASEPGGDRIALLERLDRKPSLHPVAQLSMLPSIRSHRMVKCDADPCTNEQITSIAWRRDSDDVLFTVTQPELGHAQSIFRWNVQTGLVHAVAHSRGYIAGGERYAPSACGVSSIALACVVAEADLPPRLERIDIETGKRQVLYDPNAGLAADIANSAPARLLSWVDARGRMFTGQYFAARRSNADPAPLFVTYYSCPGFLRGGVGDEWPLASLAIHGISALCINQSTEYATDAVERYGQGLSAVESVIDHLASKGEIDRAKVGVGGLSFGGEVALWVAVESRLISAASVSSPAISPLYYLLGSLKGQPFFDELHATWQLGSMEETPDRWQTISPSFNLNKVTAPTLFQLPEQEYMHALDYTIPLIRQRRADVYVFPNEPHIKFQPKHKLAAYERNLDWFRFWLQGFEDNDPRKADQYRHWLVMRAALQAND